MRALLQVVTGVLLLSVSRVGSAQCLDGHLDTAFGSGGIRVDSLGGNHAVQAVAHQSDGKLLAAGFRWGPSSATVDTFVLRTLMNGALDPSFGAGGLQVVPFTSTAFDNAMAVLQQSDGRILVAGNGYAPSGKLIVGVARLNSNGTLDLSFGSGGVVFRDIGFTSQVVSSLGVQSDGKIVVGGYFNHSYYNEAWFSFPFVLRLRIDGTLDSTFGAGGGLAFGTGGVFCGTLLGSRANVEAIAIGSDDRILMTGGLTAVDSAGNFAPDLYVARLTPYGALDSSFGTAGVYRRPLLGYQIGRRVHLAPDGKIVVVGIYGSGGTSAGRVLVVRLLPNGTHDLAFAGSGFLLTNYTNLNRYTLSSFVQSDNKIVFSVIGRFPGLGSDASLLFRLLATGATDPSFGVVSLFGCTPVRNARWWNLISESPEGKILHVNGAGSSLTLTRLCNAVGCGPAGSLDPSFGSGGVASGGPAHASDLRCGAIAADNSLLAVGVNAVPGGIAQTLSRVASNGAVAASFGSGGEAILSMANRQLSPNKVIVLPDARIVVGGSAGWAIPPFDNDPYVALYSATGSLDPSFNGVGWTLTTLGGIDGDHLRGLAFLGGKLYLAGYSQIAAGNFPWMIRYRMDGTLDPTFGTSGMVTYPMSMKVYEMLLGADGYFYVLGYETGLAKLAVAKIDSNGALVSSFGTAGLALATGAPQGDEFGCLGLQSGGKLLAAYCDGTGIFDRTMTIIRFMPNGTVDPTFGIAGRARLGALGGTASDARSLAVDPEGRILIGGGIHISYSPAHSDMGIVRFLANGEVDATFGSSGVSAFAPASMWNYANTIVLAADYKLAAFGFTNHFTVMRLCL